MRTKRCAARRYAVPRFTPGCLRARNCTLCAAAGEWSHPKEVDTLQLRALTFRTHQINLHRRTLAITRPKHEDKLKRGRTLTFQGGSTNSRCTHRNQVLLSSSEPVLVSSFEDSSPDARKSSEIRRFREADTRDVDATIETKHAHRRA